MRTHGQIHHLAEMRVVGILSSALEVLVRLGLEGLLQEDCSPSCKTGRVEDAELLAEQIAYYRARAPRYDEWWRRCGAYDRGPELAAEWDRQLALVEVALATFSVSGHVLELAGGTGWWTHRLVPLRRDTHRRRFVS